MITNHFLEEMKVDEKIANNKKKWLKRKKNLNLNFLINDNCKNKNNINYIINELISFFATQIQTTTKT